MGEEVIVARALRKTFGSLTAVDGIDFSVERGECFGLLGPNGAGKTTTVKMVHAFTPKTGGELRVFGLDVSQEARRIKARIGVVPQEDNLDPDFSVRKNLTVFARYFAIPRREARRRADELIDFVQLGDKADVKIFALSGGMKRRLIIARALINRPELLVLDEPTTGLDPQARHQVWEKVRELKAKGTTILLTTHYMEEAAQLCDRLLVIDHGTIIEQGRPDELVARIVGRDIVEIQDPPDALVAELEAAGRPFDRTGTRLLVPTESGEREVRELARRFALHELTIRRASLEDVFLRLTGRELRE